MTNTRKDHLVFENTHLLGTLDVGSGVNRASLSRILFGTSAVGAVTASSVYVGSGTVTVTGAAVGDYAMITVASSDGVSNGLVGTAAMVVGKIVTADTVQVDVFVPSNLNCLATIASNGILGAVVLRVS